VICPGFCVFPIIHSIFPDCSRCNQEFPGYHCSSYQHSLL
jgi:hypothetical protein